MANTIVSLWELFREGVGTAVVSVVGTTVEDCGAVSVRAVEAVATGATVVGEVDGVTMGAVGAVGGVWSALVVVRLVVFGLAVGAPVIGCPCSPPPTVVASVIEPWPGVASGKLCVVTSMLTGGEGLGVAGDGGLATGVCEFCGVTVDADGSVPTPPPSVGVDVGCDADADGGCKEDVVVRGRVLWAIPIRSIPIRTMAAPHPTWVAAIRACLAPFTAFGIQEAQRY